MFKILLAILFTVLVLHTQAQKACSFKIDTTKIVWNKNLDSFVAKIEGDSFTASYDRRNIPGFIRKEFRCLTGDYLLANPGQKYQGSDIYIGRYPARQLIFLARSKDVFIMTYNHGGIGWHKHILLIQFANKKIIRLWTSQAFGDLNSLNEILAFLSPENRNKLLDKTYSHI